MTDFDTYECDECLGKGFNWVWHQVGERRSDRQEFADDCTACNGRGYVGPGADKREAAGAQAASAAPVRGGA